MSFSPHRTDSTRPADWLHAPVHRLGAHGTYFFTTSTYHKVHHFNTRQRLDVLQRGLLRVAADYGWHLEAWAIFSNHYHFIAHSPKTGQELMPNMFKELHSKTAIWLNKLDGTPGRKVWHNYRDTHLTIHGSYMARLNYVHQNAVKHGLVAVASQYPWCSAGWFEQNADRTQMKLIHSMKWDTLKVEDDFRPVSIDTL